MPSVTTLMKYGFGGGIGLLLVGWASHTYFWYGYQRANPDIHVSTGAGFEGFLLALFIAGATIAFTAFSTGFSHVITEE